MIYPISFPNVTPNFQRLTLDRKQSVAQSGHTGVVQVIQKASQWQLEWTWPETTHIVAEALAAWRISLNGQEGTFAYRPKQSIASELTGITLAQDAFNYQNTIRMKGWAANASTQLRLGQYFQIGAQLLCVIDASVVADGTGAVIVEFGPELRTDFASGTAIEFANPKGLFRLNTSEGHGFSIDVDKRPNQGTMTAREATK